jgi:uncharacterized cupin superfamily protein
MADNLRGGRTAGSLQGQAIDPATLPRRRGSSYPEPFRNEVESRIKRALGDPCGLTQFGVNLVELPPGCWSSQRHWHTHEDEFVYVLEGELTLVTDAGDQILRAGMAAGFPAGSSDGHHLINRSDRPALYLEVGTRREDVDEVDYPDIDMAVRHHDGIQMFVRKSGEPYGPATRASRASHEKP